MEDRGRDSRMKYKDDQISSTGDDAIIMQTDPFLNLCCAEGLRTGSGPARWPHEGMCYNCRPRLDSLTQSLHFNKIPYKHVELNA